MARSGKEEQKKRQHRLAPFVFPRELDKWLNDLKEQHYLIGVWVGASLQNIMPLPPPSSFCLLPSALDDMVTVSVSAVGVRVIGVSSRYLSCFACLLLRRCDPSVIRLIGLIRGTHTSNTSEKERGWRGERGVGKKGE